MLKKCVVVPKSDIGKASSSFKRGVMEFEDFNYVMYNPFILKEGDDADDTEIIEKTNAD